MWPTEYTVHEHRKELLRTAAQVRLVQQVRVERTPLMRWLTRVFVHFRLRRPQPMNVQPAACLPATALRRVS